MLLGNENLSKKEEIIKTVYISEMLSLMSVPIKETKTITSVMPVKIKLFKWWLYSGFFFHSNAMGSLYWIAVRRSCIFVLLF